MPDATESQPKLYVVDGDANWKRPPRLKRKKRARSGQILLPLWLEYPHDVEWFTGQKIDDLSVRVAGELRLILTIWREPSTESGQEAQRKLMEYCAPKIRAAAELYASTGHVADVESELRIKVLSVVRKYNYVKKSSFFAYIGVVMLRYMQSKTRMRQYKFEKSFCTDMESASEVESEDNKLANIEFLATAKRELSPLAFSAMKRAIRHGSLSATELWKHRRCCNRKDAIDAVEEVTEWMKKRYLG